MAAPSSPRKKGRAVLLIAGIVISLLLSIFMCHNFWQAEEMNEDQAAGNNAATAHTGPSYSQKP
ncbi:MULTISPECIES: hypothetical protein [Sphingobium]|jgi:hypothetical protein|uniref:Uncharacterized protein n=1 Tax=Sphingomonas sanxanigenens TaxID=397260 RepID=A0A2W5C6N4_9SPHN|nr:hypothetical protein [Sphingobium yanoikuyae]PZO90895.1 MAG: hypothetical protein DI623_05105 [Sphingomonas sanxanigenens]